MTNKILLFAAMALALLGCRSRPLVTLMRGDMNMNGNMRMAGDMAMTGDMKMTGEVSTVMRTTNAASRLASVPVYASPGQASARRICVVDVDGLLLNKNMSGLGSLGENPVALFREKLDCIAVDPSIGAIVLRINSSGGGVTATDVMSRDLEQLISQRSLPVVACLMEVATGGAYYLATGADAIVAHPTSLVGGVGVVLNLYNLEDMLGQFGIVPIPVKAGPQIDMGTPQRVMQEEERAALQAIADQFHRQFVDRVRRQRQLSDDGDWSDGRVITGSQAHSLGMVDQIGYLDDAIVLARDLANLPTDAPIVMLRRDNDRAYTLLDVSPNTPTLSSLVPLKVPGLDRGSLPTFLYLWQPEPTAH